MASKKTTAKAVATKKAAKPEAPVLQQVFKTVDDLQRKDTGCTSEIDYTYSNFNWIENSDGLAGAGEAVALGEGAAGEDDGLGEGAAGEDDGLGGAGVAGELTDRAAGETR
jgi:hypothetical protein